VTDEPDARQLLEAGGAYAQMWALQQQEEAAGDAVAAAA